MLGFSEILVDLGRVHITGRHPLVLRLFGGVEISLRPTLKPEIGRYRVSNDAVVCQVSDGGYNIKLDVSDFEQPV